MIPLSPRIARSMFLPLVEANLAHSLWRATASGDGGIDGIIYFKPDGKRTEEVLVSVKGGRNVGVQMVHDLHSAMEREHAPIGVIVTAAPPTGPMLREAAAVGRFTDEFDRGWPRLQILTLAELFQGKRPAIPFVDPLVALRRAARGDREAGESALATGLPDLAGKGPRPRLKPVATAPAPRRRLAVRK